jgi:hypothetical protein
MGLEACRKKVLQTLEGSSLYSLSEADSSEEWEKE